MYREQIENYFAAHKDEMLVELEKLVNIKSVANPKEAKPGMPFGEGSAKAMEAAAEICKAHGFDVKNFDNYVVTAELGPQPAELGILAHLDVVPEGKGWTKEPYKMSIEGDTIYGRGVSDNKGPAIAGMFAMLAAQEIAGSFKKGVRLILGGAEEIGSPDLAYYFGTMKQQAPKYSFSPDASYPVINIEKGSHHPVFSQTWEKTDALPRLSFFHGEVTANIVPRETEADVLGLKAADVQAAADQTAAATGIKFTLTDTEGGVHIHALGVAAHASTPQVGKNSLQAMLQLLTQLPLAEVPSTAAVKSLNRLFPYGDYNGKALGVAQEDELSGKLTLNFSICDFTEEGFTAKYDSRTPICANDSNMAQVAKAALEGCGFTVTGNEMKAPHHVDENLPFIQTLLKVYEDYTGNKGECIAIGGGTYAHNIEGSVAFGCELPGREYNIHSDDEMNSVEELLLGAKMFTQVILDMCC